MTKLELQALGDLAAFAHDNAIFAYPHSPAIEECAATLRLLRSRIRLAVEEDRVSSNVFEGDAGIELRQLDGHWCAVTFIDMKSHRGVTINVELNDTQIAALKEWMLPTLAATVTA